MSVYTIMLAGGWESGAVLRNTIYWAGGDFYNSTRQFAGVANYTAWQVKVPKSGTIVYFEVRARLAGAGTSETVQHFIRINDTTDVAEVDLAYSVPAPIGSNNTVNQAIIAGDYIAAKISTPNWVVQPSGGRWYCQIGIQF